jgi:hypothetical protein
VNPPDDPFNDGTVIWRVGNLERRVEYLYNLEPAVMAAEVKGLREEMRDVIDELRGVRKALIGFGLSIAAGAIVFAFTAFQIWGGK